MDDGKTERIVLAHAEEIELARKLYPKVSEDLEIFKKNIKKIIKELYFDIQSIDKENDQELVRVLVINAIHKMTDEIFL
ncbi:MAG: hypothetical protein HUU50_02865 [Candidatus Brocadiae bacterium]|nr:hypothetical protein [Candidatus Brocadiia bacterium]